MVTAVVSVAHHAGSHPKPQPVAAAADAVSAMRAARVQGSRVEVISERRESSETYANPDGTSSAVIHARPVRVKQGGKWVQVDTTLVRRANGTIGPRASSEGLSLSPGGDRAPLVSFGGKGQRLALSWPGKLPAPTLRGSKATYVNVLPGVDLVIRALASGHEEDIVVKNALAAKNPALARIRLTTQSDGLRLRATPAGGLETRDTKGEVVRSAPPLAMWDSTKSAHRAVARIAVDADALTIVPDRKLLTARSTRFPVVIDPFWTRGRMHWNSVFPQAAPGLDRSPDGTWAQVGLCYPSAACAGLTNGWSYFMFDTTGFAADAIVKNVTMNITTVYGPSWTCGNSASNRPIDLYRASGGIGSGSTINNPSGSKLSTTSVPNVNNHNGPCNWQSVGFAAGTSVTLNATSTYFLKAQNEGDGLAWRKFDPNSASLTIDYNRPPLIPTNLTTVPPLAAPCHNCGGKRYYGSTSIQLYGFMADWDGDSITPTWDLIGDALGPRTEATHAPGDFTSDPFDLTAVDGKTITWKASGSDGRDLSPTASGPSSFTVDLVGLSLAPTVNSELYRPDNSWHGGAGVPGTFTFSPASNTPANQRDVDRYLYGWQSPPTTSVDAPSLNGTVGVALAPPGDGPQTLFVRSVDRAGHLSPISSYRFYARPGSGPAAQWSFEGDTKDSAYLGDHDGTLQAHAAFGSGAIGSGLLLDGAVGTKFTAPNAVNTAASFTVSAWVKLPDPHCVDCARGVATQDGPSYGGFNLWYRHDSVRGNRWVFNMPTVDDSAMPGAWSTDVAQFDTWTHLDGVYDAIAGQLRLYVNGVLQGTPVPRVGTPWNATGPVEIGAIKWNGIEDTDRWKGSIDEVKLYDRALSVDEIAAASGDNGQDGGPSQVDYWKLDQANGSTTPNEVGADSAVLNGTARIAKPAMMGDGSLILDGSNGGYATTNAPELHTSQSFTVSAWVTLDKYDIPRAVLSQEGQLFPGFALWYRPENGGRWMFGMPKSDTSDQGTDSAWASTPASKDPARRTHLVGVYDATARVLRLYVDGVLAGTAQRTAPDWDATGPFQMGRSRWGSNVDHDHWSGSIDNIRLYGRGLTDAEIRGLVGQDGVTEGTWHLNGNGDDANGRFNGTAQGDMSWTAGHSDVPDATDLAAQLNGTNAAISAPHAVNSAEGFSVTAWVRLDRTGAWSTAVSQDNPQASAFNLQATNDGHWAFFVENHDQTGTAPGDRVVGGIAQLGVWTSLVGVWDAPRNQIRLYVNGVLAGTKTRNGSPDATVNGAGSFVIGRAKKSGSAADFFPGAVDDVNAYRRVLFGDEITKLVGRDLNLVHSWRLDESSGTHAADATGARSGALSSGVTHVPGRVGNAVAFNGANGVVSTTGLDAPTDQSFSVSAWVWLPSSAMDCDLDNRPFCKQVAVSRDGVHNSKFRLGHVVDDDNSIAPGRWFFEMPNSDAPDAFVLKAAVSARSTDFNQWVHLVGTYDPTAGRLWLYVNGTRKGDGTIDNPWRATAGLQIGRGRTADQDTDYWPGSIDDVRVYTGMLDSDRVTNLYNSYSGKRPGAGPATGDEAHWSFEEGSGTTTGDATAHHRDASLGSGASWTSGRVGNSATRFDGTSNGYAATTGPVLNTAPSASWSATSWVYMDRYGPGNETILAQDSVTDSAFRLQYNAALGKWAALVPGSPAVTSVSPAAADGWTHLGVVYDATTQQLRLYVNGLLSGARTGVVPQTSSGAFTIGRAKCGGASCEFDSGVVDEVRVFNQSLADSQIRQIHDDAPASLLDHWRFDDSTARSYSWRRNDATLTASGTSFGPGVYGPGAYYSTGLQLDGTTGAATARYIGEATTDSFTVSAWAMLTRKDHVATVLAQDGTRMSGFALQYRPNIDRWTFGGATQDSDSATFTYATSGEPAALGTWTHLTGVYDVTARQLRLYVNGSLAGIKDGVTLWRSSGVFTIGRDLYRGVPSDFFGGTIDEVRTLTGAANDAEIAETGGYPAAPSGSIGRFVKLGDHYTAGTDAPPRAGYWFEGPMGMSAPAGAPNTRALYSCQNGTDGFTSVDPNCDGNTVLGEIGSIYTVAPTNLPTIALHQCQSGGDTFESADGTICEGLTDLGLLGYLPAYQQLARYYIKYGNDHISTTNGTPPSYHFEGSQGWLSMVPLAGTQLLVNCVDGVEYFLSLDPACAGNEFRGNVGYIFTGASTPTDPNRRALYQCTLADGDRMTSLDPMCEGAPIKTLLGYVLVSPPDTSLE
ncbi:LamG domain-containing protein [Kribbella sp. NPDC049227]|uniref:LamG domain-containing protein n=1 Tax=Kribbella sp. NPDC049227 TaxID=3364113 RepID=UPI003714B900